MKRASGSYCIYLPELPLLAALAWVGRSRVVTTAEHLLGWATTGYRGLLLGAVVASHAHKHPGGLAGFLASARGAWGAVRAVAPRLAGAAERAAGAGAALAASAARGLLAAWGRALGAVAARGPVAPALALAALAAAGAGATALSARGATGDDGAESEVRGAAGPGAAADEGGELRVPPTASGLLPLDLSRALPAYGVAAGRVGHLPLRIVHEGCGSGVATVVTKEVLEERDVVRGVGCCVAPVTEELVRLRKGVGIVSWVVGGCP